MMQRAYVGALQGAVGWWMVASGLTQRTEVSQYRLATHLVLALIIFQAGRKYLVPAHAGFTSLKAWLHSPRSRRHSPVQQSCGSVLASCIEAGETGGFLDVVLNQIADFQAREKDLFRRQCPEYVTDAVHILMGLGEES